MIGVQVDGMGAIQVVEKVVDVIVGSQWAAVCA